ncbi:MAG: uracil-DNA glycosylase [Acholeplasmatales bacterium]|nr:uracil-DNA glycosylase [Acholeplasmatales bacterium]
MTFEDFLKTENEKEYKKQLDAFLDKEEKVILPAQEDWYKAWRLTPFAQTKAVILGQDPYPNKIDACGLAFSCTRITKSLNNIFLEYSNDLNLARPSSGDLSSWASQGVLLLNTILTTQEGISLSHRNKGWEIFVGHYLQLLNQEKEHLVFILWGKNAQTYRSYIDETKHLVISSSHPSPLSARHSFFQSKCFSKTNAYLLSHHLTAIDWRLS